jgi:hypothetical protein
MGLMSSNIEFQFGRKRFRRTAKSGSAHANTNSTPKTPSIMKFTAKLLELIGMVVVAAGFLYGIQYSLVHFELGALVVGSGIFLIGWFMEKKS